MSRKLTLEKRKLALQRYWKTENVQDVIRDWCLHFSTDPPTHLLTLIMNCVLLFVAVCCSHC